MRVSVLFFVGLFCLSVSAKTNTLEGMVAKVIDGDTIDVENSNGLHRVRFLHVDADERGEPFYAQSKGALTMLLKGRQVRVVWEKRDFWKRILGDVYLGACWINSDIVERGWARHYKKYSDNGNVAGAELFARQHQLCMWEGVEPPKPLPQIASTNILLEVYRPVSR